MIAELMSLYSLLAMQPYLLFLDPVGLIVSYLSVCISVQHKGLLDPS